MITFYSRTSIAFLLTFFICLSAFAQNSGIRGTIKAEDGTPLSFATIFVKQTGTGTAANAEGEYEIILPPARYDLVFQYLGYKTLVRAIFVEEGKFFQLDVAMTPQEFMLAEVTVNANNEDPAYTIMRKAIAKANYHRNELDFYSARVYMKGAGKLVDYPWLAKKALEKEGVEKGRVYISESISDIKFTRPNKFEEKVISIRSDGKDGNTSPTPYIVASFYEPTVQDIVTPLSPKAFSYYKFEYLGSYTDRDYTISRIKVTPRSKGDNVVEGTISIVEEWWSIHSLDIKAQKLGIDIEMKSTYAPIEDKVWLPVSHQFKIDGKVFGFDFEVKYLATLSNYKIKLNPAIYVEPKSMDVIDEKIEKQEAKAIIEKNKTPKKGKAKSDQSKLQERLASGEEITRKELRTLVKEYEKEEQQKQKEPEVVYETYHSIDSGAYKKDSVYWETVRPVPLSKEEVIGYQKADSMSEVYKRRDEGDTLKPSKHKGFQPWDLLLGDNYRISKHSNFKIHFPIPGFNTVDGWNFVYKVSFGTILQDTNKTRLTITPAFRYAFSREAVNGNLHFNLRNNKYRFDAEGGKYIAQYNGDQPIHPVVNSFMTLFLEENLMKLYEREYVDLRYKRKINRNYTYTLTASWSKRHELYNTTDWTLVDRKSEVYTENRPLNVAVETSFPVHEAVVAGFNITGRPWLKYMIRNGHKQEIGNSTPTFSLDYRKGIRGILGSDVQFDQLEIGMKHNFKVGVRGVVDFAVRAGAFLDDDKMYFMDYKHFLGNRTPFITTDPVGSFRLLDYYMFSTSHEYFTTSVHYQFRKFLVTRFPFVRTMGIRENVFVNYLGARSSGNYTEAGYSINGIFRLFRLEAAAAFVDGQYVDWGLRVGISTILSVQFND